MKLQNGQHMLKMKRTDVFLWWNVSFGLMFFYYLASRL